MYGNMYEEYIRTVLGYQNLNNMNCNNCIYQDNQNISNLELESCYPEIYKIVYPMVKKVCSNNMGNNKEEIEKMTDEIYNAIEENNQINLNINLGNNIKSNVNNNVVNNRNEVKSDNKNIKKDTEEREYRRITNHSLRDLIKILILRELLSKPNYYPQRPHRPTVGENNMKPNNGHIPPIMPRIYNQLPYDIYEY